MIASYTRECAYCGAPLEQGERWVREKVYEPALVEGVPNYRRYHADLFNGQELSCWEKHLVETELHRVGYAA